MGKERGVCWKRQGIQGKVGKERWRRDMEGEERGVRRDEGEAGRRECEGNNDIEGETTQC